MRSGGNAPNKQRRQGARRSQGLGPGLQSLGFKVLDFRLKEWFMVVYGIRFWAFGFRFRSSDFGVGNED